MRPFTRLCFLLLLLGRLYFLSSLSSLEPAFLHCGVHLSSPCSNSVSPFFRRGAALAHLDSLHLHNLVLWIEGFIPFSFGKGDSGVLANCSVCGTDATLSFPAGPVSSSFSAEACAILHVLVVSAAPSSLPLLSSSYLTLVLSSSPPFFLPQSLWQELIFLSSCCIRLQWVPLHSFLPGRG